jgi:hypothetical protein
MICHSMTVPPTVLSPSSILPPLHSFSQRLQSRKEKFGAPFKNVIIWLHIFLK